jgi:hypothetical protein
MSKSAIKWTGAAGDGNFNNPMNWSPQQVPGPADSVTISTSAATTITISQADAVKTLSLSKQVTLAIANGDSLTIGNSTTKNATLKNAGTIQLNSSYNNTQLIVGGPKVTLSGGGTIAMGNYPNNWVTAAAATDVLDNTNNLIEGGGQLGNGTLTLVNGASGKVDANVATQLVVNTGTIAVTNAGLLEATAAGAGLVLDSNVNNGATGEILASDATVYLADGMTVSGGTLASNHGGAIDISGSATLSGVTNTVDVTGSVVLVNGTDLTLLGTITNAGTIALESSYNNTELQIGPGGIAGTVTLTGGGTVAMGDYPANYIFGVIPGDTLVNLNNTIEGAGQLGNGTLTLVNDATISATGGNVLFLNAATTNSGLIESVGAGGLTIESTISGSAGGTILADTNNVSLQGADIIGGTLSSDSTYAINIISGATLDGSTNTVTNTGSVVLLNNTDLTLLGTITNEGVISLQSNYNNTELQIGPAGTPGTVTLTGSGTVLLGNYPANYILGSGAADTLINLNNTITGAGQLGNGALTLINDATISATGGYGLVLNAAVTNNALIESLSTGYLTINATVANGTGGEILANGGIVSLSGATITGGTLASSGGAEIQIANSATLDGRAQTVTNAGTIALLNSTDLTLLGTIANQGTISLQSSYNNTQLLIGPGGMTPGTVTLTGGGTVFMGDYDNNYIQGSIGGETLVNLNNTITGAGQLGAGNLNITNDATISAVSASSSNALILEANVTNNKLIEALTTGTLVIESTINNGKSGEILANGGFVNLGSSGDIQGGTLASAGGAYFQVTSSDILDGTAHSVTNTGTVALLNGTSLELLGTINNQGTISLNSTYNDTDLIIGSPTLTLTGGGTILLGDYPNNRIYGAAGTDVLDNVNNVIEGGGEIGTSQLTLINAKAGIIDATGSNALTLTSNGSTVTNAGLIEATGAAGLIISTVVNSSSGGTILANGSDVYLYYGSLAGGLVTSANGGEIIVTSNGTLDGSAHTLTNTGTVEVNNSDALTLLGTIVNSGVIGLNSNYNDTDLIIDTATLTLTGSGTIAMGDYPNNRIYGASGAYVLDNINNVIEGAGQLGAGQLTLINEAAGIIDATGNNALTLYTGSTVINKGLIEATGAGGLVIQSTVDDSAGGTILAASGSSVTLQNATLIGGLITGAGTFYSTGTSELNGASNTFTNASSLQLQNSQTLDALGTIDNLGTLGIDSNYNDTDLIISSPTVTLTGGGQIVLTDNGNNRIYGASGAYVLDNVNNTISGAGQIGAGQLTLINGGTISATGGNALVVYLNSTGLNTGSMFAEGSGGLIFQGGTYTNQGLIQADDGSAVTFQTGALLTNDNAGGTLTGGTYAALDAGDGASFTVTTGTAVNTLAATIDLSGVNASISFGGVALGASLDMISAGGTLDLLNGNNLDLTANGGDLTDAGALNIGGGTITATTLTVGTGANLAGFGTLDSAVVNDGTITIEGGMLAFDGPLSGTGTIVTGSGGTLVLMGGGTLSQGLSGAGTLQLESGGYTLTGNTVSVMTLDVTNSASVSGFGTVSSTSDVTGTVMAAGGTLALTGAVSGNGTLEARTGATVQLAGGGDFAGAIAGAGTAEINAALTLDAGASLSAAMVVDTANLTLGAGASVANQAGNVFMLNGAGDPGARHRAQIQIKGSSGDVFANAGTLESAVDAQFKVAFANTGMVAISAGTLTFSKALSGGGMYAIASGATLDEKGGGTIAGALSGAGTLRFDDAVTLNQGASLAVAKIVQTDEVTLGSGESVTIGAGELYSMTDSKAKDLPPHRAQVEVQGGSGSAFTNAGSLTSNAASASFALSFVNSGAVSASAGTLSFLGAAANSGAITAAGATISFADAVSGTGTLAIGAGGTMALLAGAGVGQVANFQAGTGALDLTAPLSFDGTILGFGASDQIDLVNTTETSYNFANGILTVENGSATVASLQFGGSYSTGSFTLMGDGHNGTLITFK